MRSLPETCENSNTVSSFCGCIGAEECADPAAEEFCRRAADKSGSVTGDELAELKKALKDMDDPDPDDCCCEC